MRTTIIAALTWLISVTAPHAQSLDPAGHWEGIVHMPNAEVPMTADLERGPSGGWMGSVTFTSDTLLDLPVNAIAVEGATLRFTVPMENNPVFEGTVGSDGASISGKAS